MCWENLLFNLFMNKDGLNLFVVLLFKSDKIFNLFG